MNEDEIKDTVALAAEEGSAGYKRPPVKSRFPKGKSGNPFGRKKGQRNMATVLNDVLQQTVTVRAPSRRPAPAGRTARRRAMG